MQLPVDSLRTEVLDAIERGPVVLTSPTGSGKSTQVPRWLRQRGRVLVVEPRRVACRGLADRVADLEGVELGTKVGYVVRDDRRATDATEVVFVTTGIALRMIASGDVDAFGTVVLDELHERSLDLDLLLALVPRTGLIAMSATLDGDRVAAYLGGVHLHAEGRQHPVAITHLGGSRRDPQPNGKDLEARLRPGVRAALDATDGDVLVFLPGKAEISRACRDLSGLDVEVLPLHGGLTLPEQARIFRPGKRRRVICSTNVAETSLTVPRITAVVDSGLVRRTRYHHGRSYLTLLPIALDSADQRAGRAGRLGPGKAFRLWEERAGLAASTPPEIHRESLVPLLLAAGACGHPGTRGLTFLDPPKDYALTDAHDDLHALQAVDGDGGLTERGRRLFGMPLDARLGRLLVEAEGSPAFADALDLVAALSTGRPVRLDVDEDDPPECDGIALIEAVRRGREPDAVAAARRLRQAFGAPERRRVDRDALLDVLLRAWPRCVHVARRRKKGRVAWSNGGTEAELSSRSCVDAEEVDLIVALDVRGLGKHARDRSLVIARAMPVRPRQVVSAGRGRDRVAGATVDRGVVKARIERVYAGRVLATREDVPSGDAAREALAQLIERNSVLKGAAERGRERLEARGVHARLQGEEPPPDYPEWLRQRIAELGVETGEDLALLSADDVVPDDLPAHVREELDRHFPRTVSTGDATYRVEYEPRKRLARLVKVSGSRKTPPPLTLLPSFRGWRIEVRDRNVTHVLR